MATKLHHAQRMRRGLKAWGYPATMIKTKEGTYEVSPNVQFKTEHMIRVIECNHPDLAKDKFRVITEQEPGCEEEYCSVLFL